MKALLEYFVLSSLWVAVFCGAMEFAGNLMTMWRNAWEQRLQRELPEHWLEDLGSGYGLFVLPALGVGALFCLIGILVGVI